MFLMERVLEPAGERDSESYGRLVIERLFVEPVGIFRLHYDFVNRIPVEAHGDAVLPHPRIVGDAVGHLKHGIIIFVMSEDIAFVVHFL